MSVHPTLRILAFGLGLWFVVGTARDARAADDVTAPPAAADPDQGLVVVGLGASIDVVWPLARGVYASPGLRPARLDEAHARVLAGENAPEGAAAELRDLAESRAAIHGEDAASRRLLESIGASLHVKGVVVVDVPPAPASTHPRARVFLTPHGAAGSYDGAIYEADPPPPVTWGTAVPAVAWTGAVEALRRGFGAPPVAIVPAPVAPPALAIHPVPPGTSISPGTVFDGGTKESKPFYKSPWFWAAAAGAAFAATAVYLATRNDGSDNIALQVQVPK